ncbi:MAG TPA: S28 family serine protease [Polyangiaceae bacterium]|nr:S28 family serine protease [Polyangiaceae bacterium]
MPTILRPPRLATALCAALALSAGLPSCGDDDDGAGAGGAGGGAGAGGAGGAGCPGGGEAVLAALRALPGMAAEPTETQVEGACAFALDFEQPVDHAAPAGARFRQRARLLHRGADAPVSLASTGYALFGQRAGDTELSYLLRGNLLFVEHRYFPPSAPEPRDWAFLTLEQAAADHHRFVEALKPLYPGAWVSEGASKGGMTSVYHRRFYPGDVAGTVAYVAPQSEGTLDGRYGEFLERVGDAACRERIVALQREALAPPRRQALVDKMVAAAAAESRTFDFFGPDKLFEFAVGEARFLFWQYENPDRCGELPAAAASDDELYTFLDSVVAFANLYDDASLEFFSPYYYQSATQLGGPAPLELHLDGLLRYPGENVVSAYPPAGVPKPFDPAPLADVAAWLAAEAERVLFLYGEYDPWTAGAFAPSGARETRSFVVPRGNHGAQLLDLPAAEREQAFAALASWTGVTPRPPPDPASALAASFRRTRLPPRRAPRAP